MKLKALTLALFVAGLSASFALADPGHGKGNGKSGKNDAPAATATTAADQTTTQQSPDKNAGKKVVVCHVAGNSGKYVKLRVSKNALKSHLKHHDVLPDDAGKCPASAPKKAKGHDDDDDDTTSTTGGTTTGGSTTGGSTTGGSTTGGSTTGGSTTGSTTTGSTTTGTTTGQ